MRTDSPAALTGSLGLLEDELAEMEHWYAEAASWMASWKEEHAMLYLAQREVLKQQGVWDRGTTETQKKDDVEYALQIAYPDKYRELVRMAGLKAAGDKLFASKDARRSIGQTLMKTHLGADPRYGQEAHGQSGVREPAL
jgi:hypothetical protein